MDDKRRVNLMVDADVIDWLDRLAGSERKRGQYISQLIRNDWTARQAAPDVRSMDLDTLRLVVQGLAGRVIAVEGEMGALRSQLAAVIAAQTP
jgi:hypothetical protein